MVILELTELNVDGFDTNVSTHIGIDDYLTNGEKERILKAINKYKEKYHCEWQSSDLFDVAIKQLKKEGHKLTFFDHEQISF